MREIGFYEIDGVKAGHAQDFEAGTGCTVVICEHGAVAGVDVRGGAPATHETDLLAPENLVQEIHAVLLAGGSTFGLDAVSGVVAYLEERDVGFDVMVTHVPIVPGAALFDLMVGGHTRRPDKAMGYAACENAGGPLEQGNAGAGTGACVGKLLGMETAMKSGVGCFGLESGSLQVAAVVAVNCLGDVVDPENNNRVVAGLLNPDLQSFADTQKVMAKKFGEGSDLFSGNTTIGVVVTNARLTKAQAKKMASMAHNGYARAMRPAHSMYDGDTIFTMATGKVDADLTVAGMMAAMVVERACVRAATQATALYGLKCHKDMVQG